MADVVLVYPKTGLDIRKTSVDIPLSLLAAASLVARDYEVKIIDQRIEPHWQDDLRNELKKNPLCVGISSMTGPQIRFALEACRLVKETVKDSGNHTKVVWGGVHATLLPEQTVEHDLVDIVVVGEGEVTFRNLVVALHRGRSLDNVRGLTFKKDGRIIKTEPEEPVDLNELPELPYDLVDVEKYIGSQMRFQSKDTRSLIFLSSRGCPWACTYCCNPVLSKRRWRSMRAEKVYQQVMNLVEKYKLDAIAFHDEEFLVDKKRAEQIAHLLDGQVKWWIQGRMDRLKAMDLPRLEKNGLCGVQPGIESGSDRILKFIKKGETVSDILAANRYLATTEIVPLYNFMMGFPTETYDELMQSVDLALRLLKENPHAQLSGFYVLVPYPGTELFNLAVEQGFKIPSSLDGWTNFNREHLKTPWVQENMEMFRNIMLTSRLIDESRLKSWVQAVFRSLPFPLFICNLVARYFRSRWQKHAFKGTFDSLVIKVALFILSRFFPILSE